MKLAPTRNHISALAVMAVLFAIFAFVPHWGAPDFRYTGSAPDHHVWNLGWPIATCIYDSAHSPHIFVGPFAYAYALVGFAGLTMSCVIFIAWNHRGTLPASPNPNNDSAVAEYAE